MTIGDQDKTLAAKETRPMGSTGKAQKKLTLAFPARDGTPHL
jgi:hypothetical protein